jgi:hypothetical protein
MFQNVQKIIGRTLLNLPGYHTRRKIVVIESDDWGGIRMPSIEVFQKLQKQGFKPENDPYLKYDSLASEEDLSNIFEVLNSVKDKNGNPAIITANCVVANPDFKKIREHNFQKYFYEPFTETLKKYSNHQNSFNLWKDGINNNLFYPQFHGREHLNVDRWLKGLQAGDTLLHAAFENEMISISSMPCEMRFGYMEALDFYSEEEKINKYEIIIEGLKLFEQIFEVHSESFIANCYIWHKDIEDTLFENKVKYIQGNPIQIQPNIRGDVRFVSKKYHFTGQKNMIGQIYLVRNAHFEPSQYPNEDVVNNCLNRIEIAFRWNKPAIISSHRLNFIGTIDVKNRDYNLILFSELLKEIKRKWPTVEFMTSDELGQLISADYE